MTKWQVMIDQGILRDQDLPELSHGSVKQYESLLRQERYVLLPPRPVAAYDPYGADWPPWPADLRPDEILCIEVDLDQPLDLLLSQIENELREKKADREARLAQRAAHEGSARPGTTRRRFDGLALQLKVFDLVSEHTRRARCANFKQVARELGKPASTVRYNWLAACRKIGVPGRPDNPLAPDPGPLDTCPVATCRAAQRQTDLALLIKGLCPPHRSLLQEADPSLRELQPSDLSRLEHAQERRRRGRPPSTSSREDSE